MIVGGPAGELEAIPSEYSELAAEAEPSVLEAFLGVQPQYLKSSLDRLQILMWLSMAAGISAAVVTAVKLRPITVTRTVRRNPRRRRRRRR